MSNLIETVYGGRLALKKTILADFFRFGFDGSGADNFYDAGMFFAVNVQREFLQYFFFFFLDPYIFFFLS